MYTACPAVCTALTSTQGRVQQGRVGRVYPGGGYRQGTGQGTPPLHVHALLLRLHQSVQLLHLPAQQLTGTLVVEPPFVAGLSSVWEVGIGPGTVFGKSGRSESGPGSLSGKPEEAQNRHFCCFCSSTPRIVTFGHFVTFGRNRARDQAQEAQGSLGIEQK